MNKIEEGKLYLPYISTWFLRRTADEVILRLSYLESIFNYLYAFPGAIPKRSSSTDVKELIEERLSNWGNARSKINSIQLIIENDFKDKFYGQKGRYFAEIAKLNLLVYKTFKDIQIVHRFLDRRIDSLALFPLIPRRFARMSAIKTSALWREIVESIIEILPFDGTDLLLTWEQVISAKANPFMELNNGENKKIFSEVSLPVWNIFWFQQSISLYHELAEILIMRFKEPGDNSLRREIFELLNSLYDKVLEVIELHLGSIGGFTLYFAKSITNEILADVIGLLYGGIYYYVYFILSILINPKISSGLAREDFSPMGGDSKSPSRLVYNELDFSRFKEILRYRVLTDVYRDLIFDNIKDLKLINHIYYEAEILYKIMKATFSEPSVSTGLIYENIQTSSKLISHYVSLKIKEMYEVGMRKPSWERYRFATKKTLLQHLGPPMELIVFSSGIQNKLIEMSSNEFMDDSQNLNDMHNQLEGKMNIINLINELQNIEIIHTNFVIGIVKELVRHNKNNKYYKALFPLIAFGIFMSRVDSRIKELENLTKKTRPKKSRPNEPGNNQLLSVNINSRISRVIHTFDENVDLNRYVLESDRINKDGKFFRNFELLSILAIDAQHYLSRFPLDNKFIKKQGTEDFKIFWSLGHYSLFFIGHHEAIDRLLFKDEGDLKSNYDQKDEGYREEKGKNEFLSDKYWTLYSESVIVDAEQISNSENITRLGDFLDAIKWNDILLWMRMRHDFHFPSPEGQKVLKEIKSILTGRGNVINSVMNIKKYLCLRSSSWPNMSFLIITDWNSLGNFNKFINLFKYVNRSDTYILIPFEYFKRHSTI